MVKEAYYTTAYELSEKNLSFKSLSFVMSVNENLCSTKDILLFESAINKNLLDSKTGDGIVQIYNISKLTNNFDNKWFFIGVELLNTPINTNKFEYYFYEHNQDINKIGDSQENLERFHLLAKRFVKSELEKDGKLYDFYIYAINKL